MVAGLARTEAVTKDLDEFANLGICILLGCFNDQDAPCNPKEWHEQKNVLQPVSHISEPGHHEKLLYVEQSHAHEWGEM